MAANVANLVHAVNSKTNKTYMYVCMHWACIVSLTFLFYGFPKSTILWHPNMQCINLHAAVIKSNLKNTVTLNLILKLKNYLYLYIYICTKNIMETMCTKKKTWKQFFKYPACLWNFLSIFTYLLVQNTY